MECWVAPLFCRAFATNASQNYLPTSSTSPRLTWLDGATLLFAIELPLRKDARKLIDLLLIAKRLNFAIARIPGLRGVLLLLPPLGTLWQFGKFQFGPGTANTSAKSDAESAWLQLAAQSSQLQKGTYRERPFCIRPSPSEEDGRAACSPGAPLGAHVCGVSSIAQIIACAPPCPAASRVALLPQACSDVRITQPPPFHRHPAPAILPLATVYRSDPATPSFKDGNDRF